MKNSPDSSVPFKEDAEKKPDTIPAVEIADDGFVYVLDARVPLNKKGGELVPDLESFRHFTHDRTTLETGWDFAVTWEHDFIGKEALLGQKEGAYDKLVGVRLSGKGIPRHGYPVKIDGKEVGVLTSGSFSPSLKTGIGMIYLPKPLREKGTPVVVMIRDKEVAGEIVKPPFVK